MHFKSSGCKRNDRLRRVFSNSKNKYYVPICRNKHQPRVIRISLKLEKFSETPSTRLPNLPLCTSSTHLSLTDYLSLSRLPLANSTLLLLISAYFLVREAHPFPTGFPLSFIHGYLASCGQQGYR